MKITVISGEDEFREIDLFDDALVIDVKQVLEIEFGVSIREQNLFAKNVLMVDNKQLKDYCKDMDMIRLVKSVPQFPGFNFNNAQGAQNQRQNNFNNDPSAIANALGNLLGGNSIFPSQRDLYIQRANAFKDEIRKNPSVLEDIKVYQPEFAQLLTNSSVEDIATYIQKMDQEKLQKRMKEQRELEELEKDPMNPENQRKIQDIIYQQQIDDNLQMAQEYQPEVFGKIAMLYVDIIVNNEPIQAFVDTGAESTIMSKACAERCGILRLVDKRFSGVASGVGTGKILGKIHSYPIQMLDKKIPCSFTVLESINIDFLLGLDSLRRFQGVVSLRDNSLNLLVNGEELKVSFLQEQEIKKTVCIAQEQALFDEEQKKQEAQNKPSSSSSQPSSGVQIGGSSQFEDKVTQLVNKLGITRQQASQVLNATGGDVSLAENLLKLQFK